MKNKLSVLVLALGLSMGSLAQNQSTTSDPLLNKRGCGTAIPSAEWDQWFNQKVEEYKQDRASGKFQAAPISIPVIIHVIHGGQNVGTFPNISQAQINSQMLVLNADFGGTGYNVANLAATAFSAVGAVDTDISFCLAQLDPSGNPLPEPGIDRISYIAKGWPNPTSATTTNAFFTLINGTVKPGSIWNPTKYFNIWVTDVNNAVGLLGYATFPSGSGLAGLTSGLGTSTTDGIWVWSRSFGNLVGTLQAPYNRGRTATHEAGHYFGLRHIGGDGNNNSLGDCNATDYCNDTPPQKGGFSQSLQLDRVL